VIFLRPNDVSAVVLTVGEPTTAEAIESLHRQTLPLRDIIVVRDVTPFHKALNAGAAQVKTRFFVQVDADMSLDSHCIAALRSGVHRRAGIVVARLRDALTQEVIGIKLFRTACFAGTAFRDSISPDTDFVSETERRGWRTVFIGEPAASDPDRWATFGEHRPNYTPRYTFQKHVLEGMRYRYRRTVPGLRWRLARLERSPHPAALIAQIGLAHGLLQEGDEDRLGAGHSVEHFAGVERFLQQSGATGPRVVSAPGTEVPIEEQFRILYRLGIELRAADDRPTFARLMQELDDGDRAGTGWIGKVALCRGLLGQSADAAAIEADYCCLLAFAETTPSKPTASIEQRPDNLNLDAIKLYAASLGLDRFVVAGGDAAAEYVACPSAAGTHYQESGRAVRIATDHNDRSRIKAPLRLFGHVVCTKPENVHGIFWCLDLLKSGYAFVHVPTPKGPEKKSLAGQFARNILGRGGITIGSLKNPRPVLREMGRHHAPRYQPLPGRILMVTASYIRGGSERQMVVTIAGLLQRGYEVKLIAIGPAEPGAPTMVEEIQKLGVVPHLLSDFAGTNGGGWLRPVPDADLAADLSRLPRWITDRVRPLSTAILQYRPQVVHTWLDGPAAAGGLAACALGVPRVVVAQGSMSVVHRRIKVTPHMLNAYRQVARNPNVVMVNNSAAGAADYERWLGISPGRIRVLYNGFLPETVRAPAPIEVAAFRATFGFSPATPVVGTLMRLAEEKDPLLWLATAAEIARARPDVRFLIIGHGPLREAILERARSLGLASRLTLADAMTDVGLGYAALDVLLLTSFVEGVPNALVEAQAAGRPVVATDVGGTREAVADGRTGRIVVGRSPRRLAEAVLDVLDDVSWPERVRAEGPTFVAGRFGFDRMINETLDAYGLPQAAAPRSASSEG
jgi:glycosyltransferase involved in cell wall biosynthesis